MAEVALPGVLVDLCAPDFIAAPDHVYRGLLAAHQLPQHLVDEPFFDQWFDSFRDFHGTQSTEYAACATEEKAPLRRCSAFDHPVSGSGGAGQENDC